MTQIVFNNLDGAFCVVAFSCAFFAGILEIMRGTEFTKQGLYRQGSIATLIIASISMFFSALFYTS